MVLMNIKNKSYHNIIGDNVKKVIFSMYNLDVGGIETALVNILKNFDYKNLYNDTSDYAKKHYKWLVKTYNSMDDSMKLKLKNIFDSNSSWRYTNSVINLEDNSNIYDIVNTLVYDENLNLSSNLKNDIDSFFNYFYDDYFKFYFK